MCRSTDDGINSSTCNWVNCTKFMPYHFIAMYCRCGVMIYMRSCWIHVMCIELEYSEFSMSTKFSCIECTSNANFSLSINNILLINNTCICLYYIAYC